MIILPQVINQYLLIVLPVVALARGRWGSCGVARRVAGGSAGPPEASQSWPSAWPCAPQPPPSSTRRRERTGAKVIESISFTSIDQMRTPCAPPAADRNLVEFYTDFGLF